MRLRSRPDHPAAPPPSPSCIPAFLSSPSPGRSSGRAAGPHRVHALGVRARWAIAIGLFLVVASASAQRPALITVAVLEAPGVGADALATAIATIDATPGMRARRVTPDEVRGGALAGAQAALFTGGRGSVQGQMLGEDGRERVRAFVRGGGGYVGICAGAYMALQGEPEFHKIAIVAGRHATGDAWIRGIAPLRVTPGDGSPPLAMHYANGPLIGPEAVAGLSPFVVLATFDEEIQSEANGTHAGEMRGMPAALAAGYGEGRIVLFSPNPTLEPSHPELLVGALRFVAQRRAIGEGTRWRDVFAAR